MKRFSFLSSMMLILVLLAGCSLRTPMESSTSIEVVEVTRVVVATDVPAPQATAQIDPTATAEPEQTEQGMGGVPEGAEDVVEVTPSASKKLAAASTLEACPQSPSANQSGTFFGPYEINGLIYDFVTVFHESHGQAPQPEDLYLCGMTSGTDAQWLKIKLLESKGHENGAAVFVLSDVSGQTYNDGQPYGNPWSTITFAIAENSGSVSTK